MAREVGELWFDEEIKWLTSEDIAGIVGTAIANNNATITTSIFTDIANRFMVVDEIPSEEEQEANPNVFYFVKMTDE